MHAHDGARPRDSDLRRRQVQLHRLHQRQIGGHHEPREPPSSLCLRGTCLSRHRRALLPQRRVGRLRRRLRYRQDLGHAKRLRFEEGVQSPLRAHRRPAVVPRRPPNRCLRRRQREVLRPRFHVSSPDKLLESSRSFSVCVCDLFCLTSFDFKIPFVDNVVYCAMKVGFGD